MFNEKALFWLGPRTLCSIRAYQKVMRKPLTVQTLGNNGNAHSEYLGPLSGTRYY